MNRNESFLVYGVTGLLILIVLVAVLFGADPRQANASGGGAAGGGSGAATNGEVKPAGDGSDVGDLGALVNLPGIDPARGVGGVDDDNVGNDSQAGSGDVPAGPGPGPEVSGESAGDIIAAGPAGSPTPGPAGPGAGPAGSGEAGDPPALGTEGGPGNSSGGAASLSRAVPVRQSTRMGDYRRVTVERGDTFSTLVVRWCGSLDSMDLALALNESVDRDNLRVGTTLLMPWFDDDVLAQQARDREAARVRDQVASGNRYTVRSGDSLWVIASRQVKEQRLVPGYIQRILSANPGLEADALQVGQKIVMP